MKCSTAMTESEFEHGLVVKEDSVYKISEHKLPTGECVKFPCELHRLFHKLEVCICAHWNC